MTDKIKEQIHALSKQIGGMAYQMAMTNDEFWHFEQLVEQELLRTMPKVLGTMEVDLPYLQEVAEAHSRAAADYGKYQLSQAWNALAIDVEVLTSLGAKP